MHPDEPLMPARAGTMQAIDPMPTMPPLSIYFSAQGLIGQIQSALLQADSSSYKEPL